MLTCYHCGSSNLLKNGRSANKTKTQRYKCKDCDRTFTPNANYGYIPAKPITNILPIDKYCCKRKLWNDGYQNGLKRYKCGHCGKVYLDRSDD